MAFRTRMMHFAATHILERPAQKAGLPTLIRHLESHQQTIEERVTKTPDSPRNRAVFSHIIGIERWGQNRLKVALGAPYIQDEYNGYRPAKSATREELQAAFRATRAETIALAQQLIATGKSAVIVPHNMLGDLTAQGWVQYLDIHAFMESRKMW